jgi:hypothetical protein
MKEICAKCSNETLCPECNQDIFNRPLVIKHFDKEMPIIIHTCFICCKELFRSMTYESKEHHKNYCINCAMELETEAWKYRELCK